jgi:hypothetical protein
MAGLGLSSGGTDSKETAMLAAVLVRRRMRRLPTGAAYVGSFGPFYHELATTDRMQTPCARDVENGGWTLTSYCGVEWPRLECFGFTASN